MKKEVLEHFKKVDLIFFEEIKKDIEYQRLIGKSENLFEDLCDHIISQQLSNKVAAILFDRFKNLFKDKKVVSSMVADMKEEDLRAIGISWSKIRYLKNLADAVVEERLDLENLKELTDEEVVQQLIKIKGIGRWTAEMFLIFSLGREDVFSVGDLGLKKGLVKVYKLESLPSEKICLEITGKWSPYRSYGCLYLWKIVTT